MKICTSKLTQAVAGAALLAGAYSLPAAAAVEHYDIHHRIAHRTHHPVYSTGDITVRARHREPVAAAPDAFHTGPATIITAPVAIAGTLVSLPFRAVEAVFPPHANDPRMLVGAPVHLAGQIAEFPFLVFNTPFGVPTPYYY